MTVPRANSKERIEAIAREAYDRCHHDDTFEALKRRSQFSREDRGLLDQWLAYAGQKAGVATGIEVDDFGPQPQ